MDAAAPRTEQVKFNALKVQRKEALATVMRLAEARELRIDSIEDQPRRLSVDMQVTVTGDADNIVSFCQATGGIREQDPPRRLRRWIGAIIDGTAGSWPWSTRFRRIDLGFCSWTSRDRGRSARAT
jgi:hypothetical protein